MIWGIKLTFNSIFHPTIHVRWWKDIFNLRISTVSFSTHYWMWGNYQNFSRAQFNFDLTIWNRSMLPNYKNIRIECVCICRGAWKSVTFSGFGNFLVYHTTTDPPNFYSLLKGSMLNLGDQQVWIRFILCRIICWNCQHISGPHFQLMSKFPNIDRLLTQLNVQLNACRQLKLESWPCSAANWVGLNMVVAGKIGYQFQNDAEKPS